MFQIQSLEMVHWDFWQRLTVPLDAQIVTIIGPNGSGKTTLLDALRTLLALKCSGKRDYKRYVRHSTAATAWLKGVVNNPRRDGGGLFPYPFWPLSAPQVTLLCRVRRQGGDWVRHYAIVEGDAALHDEADSAIQWMGVQEYRRRLESAGLTPAIAEVLALEQGDTDKLCEYSPRQLLELVFQVFGDKAVLDHYQQARNEQKDTERELDALDQQWQGLGLRVEEMKSRANRHLEWRQLEHERRQLADDILPALHYHEAGHKLADTRARYRATRRDCRAREAEHAAQQAAADAARARFAEGEARMDSARQRYDATLAEFQQASGAAREAQTRLQERDRLEELVRLEGGANAERQAAELAQARADLQSLASQLRQDRQQRETCLTRKAELTAGRNAPTPGFVHAFREALDEAGIRHSLFSDTVEVRELHWQGAVEALLAPYRHLILLDNPVDRARAWRLGEQLRYRHFIVAERAPAPSAAPGSLLEVVRFHAEPPAWLAQQLNRVQRVASAEAGALLEGDWISRDGFYRERRGGRHIGVDPSDYCFGAAARQAQIGELDRQLQALNAAILRQEERHGELARRVSLLQQGLDGLDAVKTLAARAEEFALIAEQLATHSARAQQLGEALADADRDSNLAIEQRYDAQAELRQLREQADTSARSLAALRYEHEQAGHDWRKLIAAMRQARGKLQAPPTPGRLAELVGTFASAGNAQLRLRELEHRLDSGDWETDPGVLLLRDKLTADHDRLAADMHTRRADLERARQLTDDAREAYINKLKATVRAYGQNVKRLGELAGIDVEIDPPHFGSDDLSLHQAGLALRFNFDQKGMMGLNDGEASGGQQVMKSLILLIGLMMDEAQPSGFVFIDEPFAHLDIFNIDRVSGFLKATEAQYLITTPNTHNVNIFAPSDLTLATRKKQPGQRWAPPILQTRRRAAGQSGKVDAE